MTLRNRQKSMALVYLSWTSSRSLAKTRHSCCSSKIRYCCNRFNCCSSSKITETTISPEWFRWVNNPWTFRKKKKKSLLGLTWLAQAAATTKLTVGWTLAPSVRQYGAKCVMSIKPRWTGSYWHLLSPCVPFSALSTTPFAFQSTQRGRGHWDQVASTGQWLSSFRYCTRCGASCWCHGLVLSCRSSKWIKGTKQPPVCANACSFPFSLSWG